MNVVYLPSSLPDVAWVRKYYTEVFPEGAKHANKQIRKAEALIVLQPGIGRDADASKSAQLYVIPKTPFTFIYRVKGENLEIMRILDERSDFE